jgi:prepilin-type N-terminal cleavage/methylation domain-containing protein
MPKRNPERASNGGGEPRAFEPGANAFTLIEILVVIAIISILAALLFPVLSSAKNRSKQIGCANNLKQVALAFQMYAADNDGRLPENPPTGYGLTRWISGNMKNQEEATSESFIRQGKLFPYANDVALYHCPADLSQTAGLPRLRSYSMNSWIGSRFMETNSRASYRTFVRESELAAARPATLWTMIDEHEATIDDGWFWVTMDDAKPFASSPATRHHNGYGLNFADGHVESKKLRDPNSQLLGVQHARINPKNSDWLQLKQLTTIR